MRALKRPQISGVDFSLVMQAVLPVYLLMLLGMGLHSMQVLTPEMEKGMLKLVIHCLYPCLILDKTLGNPLIREGDTVWWGIGLGFGIVIVGMAISWVIGSVLKLSSGTGRRTFTLASSVQNYGYMAIPILSALFVVGENDSVLGVLFLHSLGVDIALWGVGLMVMTGSLLKSPKVLLNGPIVAVLIGVGLSWTEGWRWFDLQQAGLTGSILRQTMSWLGNCAFPLGIILIGSMMMDLLGKERLSLKISLGALLVRLLMMPLVILSAAKFLPIVPELKQVLVVQSAMPAAVTPIMIARHYGGSPGVAVQIVVATSALGLLTMPLWMSWGLKFVF